MDGHDGYDGRKLFNRFNLTMDKQTAKYLPYSEVVYPKLQHGMDKSRSVAELDSLWMVGFVDQEKQISTEKGLGQLKDFLELPTGAVPPMARAKLEKLYRKKKPAAEKTSTVNMHPDDMYRLEQLGRMALAKPKKGGRRKINPGKRAYQKENRKIQKMRVLKNPGGTKNTIDAEGLDDLFELERQHTKAALVVQTAWRHFLAMNFWKSYMEKVRGATAIQRIARGMIVRELLVLWYVRRTYLVTMAQAFVRSKICRTVQKTVSEWENYNCVLIQNIVRQNLARKRVRSGKVAIAATRIQCLWRGIGGRAVADRISLNHSVTKICALARGHLGRRGYRVRRAQMQRATKVVQRYFRGSRGRTWRNQTMFDRETAYRKEVLVSIAVIKQIQHIVITAIITTPQEMLAIEAEWAAEHRNKLMRSLAHRVSHTRESYERN